MNDLKPHCPNCLSDAVPAYLPYGSTPYRHCRNCGYTFAPSQAVLLRALEPVEPPFYSDTEINEIGVQYLLYQLWRGAGVFMRESGFHATGENARI